MSIKPTLLSIGCLVAASLIQVNAADTYVPLVNPGFDANGAVKTWLYTGAGVPNSSVTGWTAAGPGVEPNNHGGVDVGGLGDSGVEAGGQVGSVAQLFLCSLDSGVYQLTSHVLAAGESFSVSWEMYGNWVSVGGADHSVTATLFYSSDNGVTKTPFASTTLTEAYNSAWLSYGFGGVAPVAAAGSTLGISFDNITDQVVGAGTRSWVNIDNVVIPEPTTAVLFGFGALASLMAIRRRRA